MTLCRNNVRAGEGGERDASLQDIVIAVMRGNAGVVVEALHGLGGGSGAALPATMVCFTVEGFSVYLCDRFFVSWQPCFLSVCLALSFEMEQLVTTTHHYQNQQSFLYLTLYPNYQHHYYYLTNKHTHVLSADTTLQHLHQPK